MPELPRAEHPRPDLQRERWLSLNGPWRFAFDPQNCGEPDRWFRPGQGPAKALTITVPFPWESPLSGVAAPDYQGAAWYEREIRLPDDWDGQPAVLHFGAVDWSARVWLNGRLIAEHANGYLPFAVDLGPHLRPGESATLTVRAFDVTDAATLVGKQVRRWYTHSGGIWQSVWLEARPASHLAAIQLANAADGATIRATLTLQCATAGTYRLQLASPDGAFPTVEQSLDLSVGSSTVEATLTVPSPRRWSPDDPHLYPLSVDLAPADGGPADRVATYFGLRQVWRGAWNGDDFEYVWLNDEPIYLRGALDQAFHPDGIYTYPTDAAIRGDLQRAKDLGLNLLRCHIKLNDPRYYYWADRLGVLLFSDLPCADLDTPSMRQIWEATLRGAIARDGNHPSIVAWVLFNETWGLDHHDRPEGQDWVRRMVTLAKHLDPSRLVEDNSPNKYDHVATDLNSWHFYLDDYARARQHLERVVRETYPGSEFNFVGGARQAGQPLLNSEYAGIAARDGDNDIAWSLKFLTTELRRHPKICGYVYTELTDVEWEHNGLVNYDRSPKEFGYEFFVPGMTVADLTGPDVVGFDAPPCQTLAPGGTFAAPVFVSHWGPPLADARLRWQVSLRDRFGEARPVAEGAVPVQPRRFDVTTVEGLRLPLPGDPGLATLALWLEDQDGVLRARNYVNAELRDGPAPRVERGPGGWVTRFAPGSFHASAWPQPAVEGDGSKFAAVGSGWVEYRLAPPADLPVGRVRRLRLRAEASARAGRAKVDWPGRASGHDYPQTEARRFPSDLLILLDDQPIGEVTLPDDPADARGALSHHRRVDPGSYGYLLDLTVEGAALEALQPALAAGQPLRLRLVVPPDAPHPGGLALYGETLGAYPLDPTLFYETEGATEG
jgi:hypothetical protein